MLAVFQRSLGKPKFHGCQYAINIIMYSHSTKMYSHSTKNPNPKQLSYILTKLNKEHGAKLRVAWLPAFKLLKHKNNKETDSAERSL